MSGGAILNGEVFTVRISVTKLLNITAYGSAVELATEELRKVAQRAADDGVRREQIQTTLYAVANQVLDRVTFEDEGAQDAEG